MYVAAVSLHVNNKLDVYHNLTTDRQRCTDFESSLGELPVSVILDSHLNNTKVTF